MYKRIFLPYFQQKKPGVMLTWFLRKNKAVNVRRDEPYAIPTSFTLFMPEYGSTIQKWNAWINSEEKVEF